MSATWLRRNEKIKEIIEKEKRKKLWQKQNMVEIIRHFVEIPSKTICPAKWFWRMMCSAKKVPTSTCLRRLRSHDVTRLLSSKMSWIISFLGRFDCKVQNKVIWKPIWHFCRIVQAERWKNCQLTFMHIVIIQFFVNCNWKTTHSLVVSINFIFFNFSTHVSKHFLVSVIGETDFFPWHTNACHFVFSAHNRNEINYAHRLTEIYKWLEWHFMWSKKK